MMMKRRRITAVLGGEVVCFGDVMSRKRKKGVGFAFGLGFA